MQFVAVPERALSNSFASIHCASNCFTSLVLSI